LTELSVQELLKLWAAVLNQLQARGVVRSANNPVADYAELLVAHHFGVEPAGGSQAGYDLITKEGERIQVKGLRKTRPGRGQLSAIRRLESDAFDTLIAVVFEPDFSDFVAWRIPHDVVSRYARWSQHVNAHLLTLSRRMLSDPEVRSIEL
jgi:hypothetical protein